MTRIRRVLGNFKRGEEGATAVEFALVFLPFITLILATLEVGIHHFAARTMDSGVDRVARMMRTGELPPNSTAADFRAQLCNLSGPTNILFMFDCNGFMIDVREIAQFAPQTTPRDGSGNLDTGALRYTPGASETINMVRVYYEFPAFLNWAGMGVDDWSNDERLFSAVAMYQNEPFPD